MSDIPEAVLATAFDLVEAMQSNKLDALTAGDARYSNMLTNDANVIARALMAADEAATKRERARIASLFTAEATAIEVDEHEKAQWAGPDPRGSRVRHLRLDHARELRNVASAILKGEA